MEEMVNAQVANNTQPQEGTNEPPTAPQAGDDLETLRATIERVQKELTATRKEAAGYRVKLKEHEDAQLSELERAKKAAEEATTKVQAALSRIAGYEVGRAAQKLGIVDPDVAHALIGDKIELDEHGVPTNAEPLLRALAKEKPYLVNAASIGGSPTNPPRDPGGKPVYSMSQIRDVDFYAKHEKDILAAYKDGRVVND